jgi:hypothetical protein
MLLWNVLQFIRLLQEASKGQRADSLTPQQRREKCAPNRLGPCFVFTASCFRLVTAEGGGRQGLLLLVSY